MGIQGNIGCVIVAGRKRKSLSLIFFNGPWVPAAGYFIGPMDTYFLQYKSEVSDPHDRPACSMALRQTSSSTLLSRPFRSAQQLSSLM
jgi:hypothetical protein